MTKNDFESIKNITPESVIQSGARIEDVQFLTIHQLDTTSILLNRTIIILPNGLTSGKHSSPLHPRGLAVDFCLREVDGEIDPQDIVFNLVVAGFRGIGVYHNGAAYSFHADIRKDFGSWSRWRKHREVKWKEQALINDPRRKAI